MPPTEPGVGDYNDPANWVGGVIPGTMDSGYIANGDTATISANTPPAQAIYVGGTTDNGQNTMGDGTIDQTAGNVVTVGNTGRGWLTLGQRAGSTGTYNLSGGNLTLGNDYLELSNHGTGFFNLTGANSTVSVPNLTIGRWSDGVGTMNQMTGHVAVGSRLEVGEQGTGTYQQTGGDVTFGSKTSKGDGSDTGLDVGAAFTNNIEGGTAATTPPIQAHGTYNLTAGTLTENPGATGPGGWNFIGHGGGSGTFNISGTATATFSGRLHLGNGAGLDPTDATKTMFHHSAGVINQTGGTLTVQNKQDIVLGDGQGSGTYNLSAGTLNASGLLAVGHWIDSQGVLNVSGTGVANIGGDLNIGTYNETNPDATKNDNPNNNPTTGLVNQTGGTIAVAGQLVLGDAGTVGGTVTNNTNGTFQQSGGTFTTGNQSLIGNKGTGTVTLTGGSFTAGNDITIASQAGSTGTLNLQGAGGAADKGPGGVLDLGGHQLKAGAGAAQFNFTGGMLRNVVGSNFAITQAGGTLEPGPSGGTGTTTITTGDYTNNGGKLLIDLTSTGSHDDLILSSGTFHLSGASLSLHVPGGGLVPTGSYVIVDPSAPGSGTFSNAASTILGDNGQPFTIVYNGGDGDDIVVSTNVPEPAVFGLLGLGAIGLLRRRRA